ncbi:MAG: septum formation protein [Candidatus Peregrinibacteria bacterium Gr01-1014_25]|nr:MAG: septum formation protein [Candidatus Peregrinibacteria bacterium Gr01-1014_25]
MCGYYSFVQPLILASASPQRRSLLTDLAIAFEVLPSTVDERACAVADPAERAVHLARLKARDIAGLRPDRFVLGCDTLVVSQRGILLEKPVDADDALRMLHEQSGGVSVIHSALCLVRPDGEERTALSSSRVRFAALTEEDMRWWIGTRLWEGRSGAFQIDGPGQMLIEHLDGDWTGVVGLPVFLLGKMLREEELL